MSSQKTHEHFRVDLKTLRAANGHVFAKAMNGDQRSFSMILMRDEALTGAEEAYELHFAEPGAGVCVLVGRLSPMRMAAALEMIVAESVVPIECECIAATSASGAGN